VIVSTVWICTTLWLPGSAVSAADSATETPKERSPEEAAGGKQNLQRIQKACEEDVKKLCPEIRPGGGRILQCLHGQESKSHFCLPPSVGASFLEPLAGRLTESSLL